MLSTESPKTIKADKHGYLNAILYMAPHTTSGVNLCPKASPACSALCLGWFSGQASIVKDLERGSNSARAARIRKAQWFMRDRQGFMTAIADEIHRLSRRAFRKGKMLCVRLNGSTDIAWEGVRFKWRGSHVNIFEVFPDVQFVDYTKIAARFDKPLPRNYHLTFSRSETNEAEALRLLGEGRNVAVVFEEKPLHSWHGYTVVDGDEHDLRHLDPRGRYGAGLDPLGRYYVHDLRHGAGYVIALSPKGNKIKRDQSGFVVRDTYAHDTVARKGEVRFAHVA
jgi:hypothetical protein